MFVSEDQSTGHSSRPLLKASNCSGLGYGRFLQADPVGYDDQLNLYAYVANDPLNRTDPTGKAGDPGDPFDTASEAAADAIRFINPKSIAENREYAGYTYVKGDKVYASPPTTSNQGDRVTHSVPRSADGDYHTHGDYSKPGPNGPVRTTKSQDGYNSDHFSQGQGADTGNSELLRKATGNGAYRSYLGTPSGKAMEYDPVMKVEKQLQVIPPPPPPIVDMDDKFRR